MSDNLPPDPTTPAEAGTPTTVTSRSGGVNLDAQRDVNIGGDVVGRDKITQIIANFFPGDTAQRALRNRRDMLELVRRIWVEGVLEKSLHRELMIDLHLEEWPGEVQRPWDMLLQMSDHEKRRLPTGTKIIQVFDSLYHALLILGKPGAGKTTILLELARDAIARAEQDLAQPIPVVFNLSSWSGPQQSITEWLVKELADKYVVSERISRPWIENDDLLLLLDGLDEVKTEYREDCIKAINSFRDKHGQTQLVVCSRVEDYQSLTTKLRLWGAVVLQLPTSQQIEDYLERAGAEMLAALEAYRRDTELQELVQSLLMLGIMTQAYRGMPVESVLHQDPSIVGSRRKHLFDAYCQQMFSRIARTNNRPYSKKQTTHWLGWLAQKLIQHTQSMFLLYQLPINWLPTYQRWLFRGFFGLAFGLVFSIILGIAWGLAFQPGGSRLASAVVFVLISAPVLGITIAQGEWRFTGLKLSWSEGLKTTEIALDTTYQKVIEQSRKNALLLALFAGLSLGGALAVGTGLGIGVLAGIALGLLLGLYKGGGMALIQHVTLLYFLRRNDSIPRNYVDFLDFATDRIFLRKMGGGYMFIHRMLMDYFAALETQSSAKSNE
jgi:hypothetical protein